MATVNSIPVDATAATVATAPGFASRHIGPNAADIQSMLETIGLDSVDQLIAETVPGSILAPELYPFFRDVYDHSLRLLDMVETLRDLLNNTFDVYLSSVANRTNQVMKVLTVLSTIALPALVISGIYGMNLKGLPFLESDHGTEIIVGAMIASTGIVLWMLKRFDWL